MAMAQTVSVEEAAEALGIGRNTAYKLARKGQLPGVIELGKRMVVSRAVLERVLGEKLDTVRGDGAA